jgi:pyruvate kinase
MTGRKSLFCTLGPSSLDRQVIADLEREGVTSFRINMSHTPLEDLERVIHFIQECSSVPICLDTEGAQIRTGTVAPGFEVSEGSVVRLVDDEPGPHGSTIPITPRGVIAQLEPSARVSIDFDSVVLRIDRVQNTTVEATVLTGGGIGSHKAVTAFPSPRLPAFTEKDRAAEGEGVLVDARSFCEDSAAVHELREIVGPRRRIIAKIESRQGVRNMRSIAWFADGLLIDRGDLSREVRLEAIPLLQKAIIRKANALGIPVYVATNLLESMVARRAPTRAEVNDVMNTLLDGADGLVLAAETAIGRYPAEAARMIMALLDEYEGSIDGYRIEDLLGDHPLSLDRSPHRGAPTTTPSPKEVGDGSASTGRGEMPSPLTAAPEPGPASQLSFRAARAGSSLRLGS